MNSGTGTPAGDPLETAAISKVFGKSRPQDKPLLIGSVKTNVGHLEGASGVAGVIKAILMLENETILPNRNFQKGNPNIPFSEWRLAVPTSMKHWNVSGPRRISINSFGYGGTNGHAILEDAAGFLKSRNLSGASMKTFSKLAPSSARSETNKLSNGNGPTNGDGHTNGSEHMNGNGHTNGNSHPHSSSTNGLNIQHSRIFTISAFDEASGKSQARKLSQYLSDRLTYIDDKFLGDLAYTLGERRSKLPWKSAVAAGSAEQLIEAVGDLKFSRSKTVPALAFVFTGQGAQWHAMGRELVNAFPVYAKTLSEIGRFLKTLGAQWDVIEELSRNAEDSKVATLSQPLCSAIQIALVDLLASWDIKPVAVTGHSSGEIAAAYCAGALSAEDAMTAAYYRGIFSNELKDSGRADGGMIAVGLSRTAVLPVLAGLTQGKATVACENSPASVTVSGDSAAVTELEAALKESGTFARRLPVRVAYHSWHMNLVAEQYLASISHIKAQSASKGIEYFSSVTGDHKQLSELGASYWVENMLGEVKFSDSLHRLCLTATAGKKTRKRKAGSNIHTIVEIGPHSALAGPIKQILQADDRFVDNPIAYQTALVRKSSAVDTTLTLASKLVLAGYPVNLSACNNPLGTDTSVLVDLPAYSWNHSNSYWAESRVSKTFRGRKYARTDILGAPDKNANPLEPRWRNIVRTSEIPWIKDHKVQTNTVYPAAGYLAMAIEAAHQRAEERGAAISGYKLREVSIGQALVIPEQSGEAETLITLRPYPEGTRLSSDIWDEFYVYSVTEDERWTEHCHGLISVQKQISPNEVTGDLQIRSEIADDLKAMSSIKARCDTGLDIPSFYEQLTAIGLEYGPTFANVKSAMIGPNVCVASIAISDTASTMPMGFQYPVIIHPATLDSMFHGLFAALTSTEGNLKDPVSQVTCLILSILVLMEAHAKAV